MTTTELIKILQDNERGGISHKPRNISLCINGRYMPNPQISLSSTGDGICGPEIDLDIDGDWFEREEERMKIEKPCNLEVPTGATPMTIADVVVRECPDKEILEDVVYYINAYITREWGNETHIKENEDGR